MIWKVASCHLWTIGGLQPGLWVPPWCHRELMTENNTLIGTRGPAFSIKEDRKKCFDHPHDCVYPNLGKTQFAHNSLKVRPLQPVICLHHVQLEGAKTINFGPVALHKMQTFVSTYNIVCYESTWHKCWFLLWDYVRQNKLQSVGYHFRRNFVKNVAQTNGSQLSEMSRVQNLGDQDKYRVINAFRAFLSSNNFQEYICDLFPTNAPMSLIKVRRKPVRARGLHWEHPEKSTLDLIISIGSTQSFIHTGGYSTWHMC